MQLQFVIAFLVFSANNDSNSNAYLQRQFFCFDISGTIAVNYIGRMKSRAKRRYPTQYISFNFSHMADTVEGL